MCGRRLRSRRTAVKKRRHQGCGELFVDVVVIRRLPEHAVEAKVHVAAGRILRLLAAGRAKRGHGHVVEFQRLVVLCLAAVRLVEGTHAAYYADTLPAEHRVVQCGCCVECVSVRRSCRAEAAAIGVAVVASPAEVAGRRVLGSDSMWRSLIVNVAPSMCQRKLTSASLPSWIVQRDNDRVDRPVPLHVIG